MKIAHITGARPNFPKMAPVERALRAGGHSQLLIHTGQHFDHNLSQIFFEQLGIPAPDVNLAVGSASHARQTANVMTALEPVLLDYRPDSVFVYGDVNSTLAAALVAAKLDLRVVHIEAGLRSYDRSMPEEINRLAVDAVSDQFFTTALEASDNLLREGSEPASVHFVGNTMIDTLLRHKSEFMERTPARDLGISGEYALVTLHRPSNVDSPSDARELSRMLMGIAENLPVLFPVHPRTASRLSLESRGGLILTEPLGYLEFLAAMARARLVVTDSGGVQEETTMLGTPCFTVRPNTERPVTITHGSNRLASRSDIPRHVRQTLESPDVQYETPPLWDGRAGERIADIVDSW